MHGGTRRKHARQGQSRERPGARRHTTAKLRVTDNNGGVGLAATTLTVVSPVYVSWSTGSDSNNGTIGAPVATLSAAYALATGARNGIMMEQGVYTAVPSFQNGIRVLGGRVLPGWGVRGPNWPPTPSSRPSKPSNYSATRAS